MAKFNKKKDGDLPAVSTASLPDIVFMLLFFFMTVTTMKDSTLMVENTLPNASEVKKLEKKDRVIYIYVGKPTSQYQKVFGSEPKIQLNDKFASVSEVGDFILAQGVGENPKIVKSITSVHVVYKVKGTDSISDAQVSFQYLTQNQMDDLFENVVTRGDFEKINLQNIKLDYKNSHSHLSQENKPQVTNLSACSHH